MWSKIILKNQHYNKPQASQKEQQLKNSRLSSNNNQNLQTGNKSKRKKNQQSFRRNKKKRSKSKKSLQFQNNPRENLKNFNYPKPRQLVSQSSTIPAFTNPSGTFSCRLSWIQKPQIWPIPPATLATPTPRSSRSWTTTR